MDHRRENCKPLDVSIRTFEGFQELSSKSLPSSIWLFHLTTEIDFDDEVSMEFFNQGFADFLEKLPEESTICFLANPRIACYLIEGFQNRINFKLWIAVKRMKKTLRLDALPDDHIALLVFTCYKGSLRHNKTQIEYTYCPACKKTTHGTVLEPLVPRREI